MAAVSERRYENALDKVKRASNRLKSIRDKAEEKTLAAVHTAETVGGGFVTGWVRGRAEDENGNVYIPGTKIQGDLAAGVVLAGFGIADGAGKASSHLLALGSGVLAGWSAITGRAVARERQESGRALPVIGGSRNQPIIGAGQQTIVGSTRQANSSDELLRKLRNI